MKNISLPIVVFVLFAHIVLLIPMMLKKKEQIIFPFRQKIAIHTHTLSPTSQQIPLASSEPVKPKEPKKASPSPVKKEVVAKKKTSSAPPKTTKKQIKKKELVDSLKKSLKSLETPKTKTDDSNKKNPPSPKLTCEAPLSDDCNEPSYLRELITYLQNMLILPEKGNVKVRLTLSCQGQVIESEVLFSESKVNQEYVSKMLPTLSFPPFLVQKKRVFTLNLEGKIYD